MFAPTRWLLELYPIDEILATELKIDLGKIRFEKTPIGSPAYEVIATARGRRRAVQRTFEPKLCRARLLRSISRLREGAGDDRVDQGATSRAAPSSTSASSTDPERFWDHLPGQDAARALRPRDGAGQGQAARRGRAVLRRAERRPHAQRARVPLAGRSGADLVDGGDPRGDLLQHAALLRRDGPLHARRRARVSGPHDSGHAPEGGRKTGPREDLASPASTRRGRRSSSSIAERNGRRGELRLDIPKIAVERPQTLAAAVRAGRDGIERLDLRVKVDTEQRRARRARHARGARSASIGRSCRRSRSSAVLENLAGCMPPASTATRSRTTILAGCA